MEIGPDSSNENGGRCPRPQLLKEVPFLENTSVQNNFHFKRIDNAENVDGIGKCGESNPLT